MPGMIYEYDSIGGSGTGGGAISVFDEQVLLESNTKQLKFVGADVSASKTNTNEVTVYIPSASFSPFYNTGAGSVPDISTQNRHVANPTAEGNPYKIGDWSAGTLHACTNSGTWNFNSPVVSFEDETTTVEAFVYDADGVEIATLLTPAITGNTVETGNNIRIEISNFAPENSKFMGRIRVRFTTSAYDTDGGRYSIRIVHHNSAIDYIKVQSNVFYDPNPINPDITGITIQESIGVFKYLSGLKYYDEGSTFQVDILDIDNINNSSYPTNFIFNDLSEYGIPDQNLGSSDLTNWNYQFDDIDDTYQDTSATITQDDYRFIGTDCNIATHWIDWTNGSDVNSPNKAILIDTWDVESDELSEYFIDESFRRVAGYTGSEASWDSTQDMTSYDDNSGLMVQDGRLQTMRTDWSSYEPTGNPNYTGFSGAGTYFRRFIDISNLVRGNCSIAIQGFTLQNLIDEDVKMWIMIPGRFTSPCFVHGAALYDFGTFNGDNDPIRTGASTTNDIRVSFGTLGLDSTHNEFIMGIEISDSTIRPESIVVSW